MTLSESIGNLLTDQGSTYVWKDRTAFVQDGYGGRASETTASTNITGIVGELDRVMRDLLPEGFAQKQDKILLTTTDIQLDDAITVGTEDYRVVYKHIKRDLLASNAIFSYSYVLRKPL